MFHTCTVKFDVTKNLQKFLVFGLLSKLRLYIWFEILDIVFTAKK